MATGELTKRIDESELGYGEALMATGRVSTARMYEPAAPAGPFTTRQLARLDEALTFASRETGLDFSLYLGELGADSRATAEKLHATTADPANAVLIAVSPGERLIEIVTGKAAYVRLPDRGAKLAVASMVASFKEGDLVRGLVNGLANALRMLSDQAGPAPR
ncbi:DUF5130 family protein [Amycolatopsis sp. CA-128772]|uniref:DUF5130 family protein n=1 Tax=Amycolatopsis sp. CA-128772 TaxID=2073159 RepID=UPI000CD1C87C|nr:DUF5130 family protein [Amycolatopsis sp. CA-128772]